MRDLPGTEMLHQPTDKTITGTISIIKIELLHHLQDIFIIANVAIIGGAGIAHHDKEISNQEVIICLLKGTIVQWRIESPQQIRIPMETGIIERTICNSNNQTELIIRPLQSSNQAALIRISTHISIQPNQKQATSRN